ncbi:hypothetical protein BDV96DRAFT_575349 [Lophiotrema nucula]|uniref:Nab2-like CCCH zinc finger domain-containing protein n=1 Tax=Lophiotrema nucula TaxID=690887 RepID=A0A6A5Z7U8_9PLEO|nr:hypothetical protein BDV96DRAFT_575349 [Lophiotrema nucula]
MDADFTPGSQMAGALHSIVQPKLVEYGWTTEPEDATLFEYILAMLDNDKNEGTIAGELANDLLGLGPENLETQQFAHWLFEQIGLLRGGNAAASDAPVESVEQQMESGDMQPAAQDTDMDGADAGQSSIPTGPKAMRNGSGSGGGGSGSGSGSKPQRGGRMLNNINRSLSRQDDSALHRIRGTSGTGRINSHSREPPKGPRGSQVGRGLEAMANRGGVGMNGGIGMGHGGMNGMNGNMMNGMPSMPMPPMGGPNNMGPGGMLNPQQQLALMQMYEQQAQMMQQIFSGQPPTTFVNPNFPQQGGSGRGRGKPLIERMDKSGQHGRQNLPPSSKFSKKGSQDEAMSDGHPNAENGDGAMDVEGSRPDAFSTMCKFNLRCSKPDCPFAHQSAAAPDGTPLDMNDTCQFGAACTNKKCVGKHPSPAQRHEFQAQKDCVFYPNCRDMANCPYKHPSMPPCRNGADCQTPGCKFWHSTTMCKFNPCTNRYCTFKHAEGQKKTFKDKVWVAPKAGDEENKEHVSDRKFAEEGPEELIIPGQSVDTEIVT